MSTINWWINASFAVHHQYKSHTGATISLGKRSVISLSTKQNINTHSLIEAELVGVNDALTMIQASPINKNPFKMFSNNFFWEIS